MMVTRLAAILTVGWTAFAQAPRIHPRVVLPGEAVGRAFWLFAPDIAVVRIERTEWLGPEIEITPPAKMVVRMVRVNGVVENVIRGELRTGDVEFYYFTNTFSSNGYHTVISWLDPGSRYILFLRTDGEVLRTMADVATLNVPVLTGPHDRIPNPQDSASPHDAGGDIAYLALTPSAAVEKAFAVSIERICDSVVELTAPSTLARLLRDLLASPDTEVQDQACLSITRRFMYRDPCVERVLRSNNATNRQQAEMWSRRRWRSEDLVRALNEGPFSLSMNGEVSDFAAELELYTLDYDIRVRRQACDTLRRLFPTRVVPNCTVARR